MLNSKIKTRLEVVRNEGKSDVTDIYLYGRIGNPIYEGEETITVNDVKKKLKEVTTNKLKVHLNSDGGCLFSAIAINNLFKSHKADIEMVIDSVAASGGAIIAMAGNKITMYSNSMLFIHPAHTLTYADAKGHRNAADQLDKMDKSLKENYKARFTGTDKELESLIQEGTWLTAEEAKEFGFCDEIIENDNRTNNASNSLIKNLTNNRKQSKVVADLMKKYSNKGNKQANNNLFKNFK